MALRALLFDVDGTLADTEPQGHLPAYNRAFRDLGLDWKWSKRLYRKLLLTPGGRERIDQYLSDYQPDLGPQREHVERDRGGWIDTLHKLKSKHFRRRLKAGRVALRPGVRRLMREADERGLQIALASNASRATLKPFLTHTLGDELRDRIDLVISGEDVAHKKPAPDIYLEACRHLHCRPDECLVLEDSAMGVQAARAAGIPVVVTVNADTRDQEFPEALLVVDQLGEPEQPCEVLSGDAQGASYVDVDLLKRLLSAGWQPSAASAAV